MKAISFLRACALSAMLALPGLATAKSLYVIANINGTPTPINTYDIQATPTELVFQATQNVTRFGGGAVGLGIDTTNKKLFVTYEVSNTIQLLDANTFANLGTTTAPGATNLAGIVVDQGKSKVYTVDRETNHLYVYSWNSGTNTLTLDGGTFVTLPGVTRANGIALDETRGRLYIGDRDTTTVRYFNTTGWALAGSFVLAASGQTAMSIAVDPVRNLVYTGNAYGPYGSLGRLVKYDLNTNTESFYTLPQTPTADNIVGVAVDNATGKVYATTGDQGFGGTDSLLVFSSNLVLLKNQGYTGGDPTGLAIPTSEVSYNPLNLSKSDGGATVAPGQNVTYDICFSNPSAAPVTGVTLTDAIPSGASFVSATGGGTLAAGVVTWNIGTLAALAPQQCVQLTLQATGAAGTTITNQVTIDSVETPPTTTSDDTPIGGPAQPTSIPTLSEWGMIILSSLLALGAVITLRRQRQ